jgi:hypothetical protein
MSNIAQQLVLWMAALTSLAGGVFIVYFARDLARRRREFRELVKRYEADRRALDEEMSRNAARPV